MKALIYDNGLFVHLAQKLSEQYSHVYYFNNWSSSFPNPNDYYMATGYDFEKVYNFFDYIDDADVIIFPDCYAGDLQAFLRSKGYNVWGSGKGEEMEIFRGESKKLLEEIKLPVNEYEIIKGFENLKKYLKGKKDKYVKINGNLRGMIETFHYDDEVLSAPMFDVIKSKITGYEDDIDFVVEEPIKSDIEGGTDTFFVDGKFPDTLITGYEIKDEAYLCRAVKRERYPKMMLNTLEKLSPVMEEYNYRGFFSTEEKIVKNKSYLIDMTCFSEDTEILTNFGWKYFKDLNGQETVATLNPETGVIEYHKPYAYQKIDYNGEMISLSNRRKTVDFLVTPDHTFYAKRKNKRASLKPYKIKDMNHDFYIPRTGTWNGYEQEYFVLPKYNNEWKSGRHLTNNRKKRCEEVKVKMDDWLRFLAIYISDGSMGRKKYITSISQFDRVKEYKEILNKLPFKFKQSKRGFQCSDVQLGTYMKQFGICDEKFIPDYVKQLSQRQIKIFLDTYTIADGYKRTKVGHTIEERAYFTTSKKLADDLQELVFKSGDVASINENNAKGTIAHFPDGKSYMRKRNMFSINVSKKYHHFYFEGWNHGRSNLYLKKEFYRGFVYDVTVKNHIIYVRRKGRCMWSGNCRLGLPSGASQLELITNYGEIIYEGSKGKMVQPKFKSRYAGEVMICSPYAKANQNAVYFPEKISSMMKISYSLKRDGIVYTVPKDTDHIGTITATGDTVNEVREKLLSAKDQIKGYDVHVNMESFEKAVEAMKNGVPIV